MAELFARLHLEAADGTPMPLADFPPARALRGEQVGSAVVAFQRDGQKVWIYAGAEPIRAADGAVLGAVFSCVDISELRALQVQQQGLLVDVRQRATELALERDRLRIVVESIADAVFVCDAAGKITLVNKAGQALIGAQRVEAAGTLADYLSTLQPRSPDGHPVPLQDLAISQALGGQVVLDRQEIGIHPVTHRRVDLLVSAAPLRNGANRVVGAVEVVRDITELRELDRMKDEFLGVAAHELKTPVTITKGYSQVLLHSAQNLSQPQRRMLESIDRGADRIDNLVGDLLDIVRLQSEGLRLHRDRINLAELAEGVADRIAAISPRHRLRLVQKGPVVVQGDRRRLEQVLETLLDNALRYSPGGGDVDLSVSVEDTAAVVTVRDYGVGIPADRQARIGQRFYRAHTGTPYDYGGMGVGLYIAREIVERHGGRLWFESEEGKGSAFHFSLPLQVENVDAR
ncbi:MAG: sensor histidine kinase, partial [Chloroflexota bacterium]